MMVIRKESCHALARGIDHVVATRVCDVGEASGKECSGAVPTLREDRVQVAQASRPGGGGGPERWLASAAAFAQANPLGGGQMDFKGHFALGAVRCHALTVLDDHSRYSSYYINEIIL